MLTEDIKPSLDGDGTIAAATDTLFISEDDNDDNDKQPLDLENDIRTTIIFVAKDTAGRIGEASFLPRHGKRHMGWYKRRIEGATELEPTVDLPTAVNLDAFTDFSFYVQENRMIEPPASRAYSWLLHRLVFAEQVESNTFMKETLNQFIETVKVTKSCPDQRFVQRVYEKTQEGASLRKLMVDLIVWEEGVGYMKAIDKPLELVQDV